MKLLEGVQSGDDEMATARAGGAGLAKVFLFDSGRCSGWWSLKVATDTYRAATAR